ncbi:DNA-dependent metalloprotease WSS1 [Tolypocladium ophioglossoides CBS 100239]|uniref:DNA-dependent metalloprotease WSS1 n=1 Tax=Tolypocladium ophioglossoides (strain CBS 100239) TaxID=1163406 RepID=A0A0L0NAX7_TOLOC|nr:DNA-dependent metalloprotease WSS1 [Tolypocladium ophioglossoides CBS 100239]
MSHLPRTHFVVHRLNLPGLNVNAGSKIFLRLRHNHDRTQFLPFEEVVDTMLHELCHIVHSHHHRRFNALWDQLRDELQGLMMKGYTGEGFLSEGRRLGGTMLPAHEVRRLARAASHKPQDQSSAVVPGRRLGGAAPRPGQDVRKVIADAVDQRNEVLRGCAAERLSDREAEELADVATRNGFRTQAEEDEANEVAIAQALWELVQEEEKQRLKDAYIEPSVENPEGYRGGSVVSGQRWNHAPGALEAAPRSRGSSSDVIASSWPTSEPSFWVCEACTLHNPLQYLCCDACGAERQDPTRKGKQAGEVPGSAWPEPTMIDLTQSPPRDRGRRA